MFIKTVDGRDLIKIVQTAVQNKKHTEAVDFKKFVKSHRYHNSNLFSDRMKSMRLKSSYMRRDNKTTNRSPSVP